MELKLGDFFLQEVFLGSKTMREVIREQKKWRRRKREKKSMLNC